MTPLVVQRPRAERSFERIYRRHVTDVYRYCFAVLRNRSDAEDVVQTTFMNAYRAFQRGERPREAHNWLIAIAHNVCRQRFRQSQRRVEEVAYDDGMAEAIVPDEDAPTAEDLRRALGHLTFNQRAGLVMRELEGRSYAEIADVLGLSVSAVETLLFRARRALREQLEGGLTCHAAELAVSRQLDGQLSRKEQGALRAHLRECRPCAGLARKQRAQRTALRAFGAVPLPASLAPLFGGSTAAGATALGGGVAAKAAAVAVAGVVLAGAGYEIAQEPAPAAPAESRATAAVAAGVGSTGRPARAAASAQLPAGTARTSRSAGRAVPPRSVSTSAAVPRARKAAESPAVRGDGRRASGAAVPGQPARPEALLRRSSRANALPPRGTVPPARPIAPKPLRPAPAAGANADRLRPARPALPVQARGVQQASRPTPPTRDRRPAPVDPVVAESSTP